MAPQSISDLAANIRTQGILSCHSNCWVVTSQRRALMKECTYCGKEYSDEATACTLDGQLLRVVSARAPEITKPEAQTFPKTDVRRVYFGVLAKDSPLLRRPGAEQAALAPGNIGKLIAPDSNVTAAIEEREGPSLRFFVRKRGAISLNASDIEQATARKLVVNGVWIRSLLIRFVQYSILPVILVWLNLAKQKSSNEVVVVLFGGALLITGMFAFLSTLKQRKASWEYTLTLKDGRRYCFQAETALKETGMMKALLQAGSISRPTLLISAPRSDIRPTKVSTKLTWYEHLWTALPIGLVAIGGGIGGVCGFTAWAINKTVFKKMENPVLKYVVTGLISASAVVLWFVVGAFFWSRTHGS